MGQAIPVRTDYTAGEVRRFAQRAKDAAQARRLLAIAAVLEGASREEAAKIGGMDRQTPATPAVALFSPIMLSARHNCSGIAAVFFMQHPE